MKKFLGMLAIASFMAINVLSCASQPEIVTQSLYDALGKETFSQFRFYISQAVVLTEVVPPEIRTNTSNTRVQVTAYNNIVNIKSSTTGRVQSASHERLEIAFEQLRDGTYPSISFVQKRNDGRYYFEYEVSDWVVADKSGRLISNHGPGIQYNGKIYFLDFKGNDEPYLLYDQDVVVRQSQQTMRGLR